MMKNVWAKRALMTGLLFTPAIAWAAAAATDGGCALGALGALFGCGG